MMPVVRIGEDTWERLKKWAIPLEDTADDAVRRVLDAAEGTPTRPERTTVAINPRATRTPSPGRAPAGAKVPQTEYEAPILVSLLSMGGRGRVQDVLSVVEQIMKSRLGKIDYEPLKGGGAIRWHNTVQWARYELVKSSLLRSDSSHGVWELTDEGRRLAENNDVDSVGS